MRNDRDDFLPSVKDVLARRVGCRCCNPGCRKLTSGSHEDPTKAVNIGVAAHITAAAPGGKRYDPKLSSEERKAIKNGIWLCQNCGKLIDSDEQKYSVELLVKWKRDAEQQASAEVENSTPQPFGYSSSRFEEYLKKLVDTPQTWWLDEINESTWYEFELFTAVQKKSENPEKRPKDARKPILKAIYDTDKQSILITGEPGAGKSTLLEKLAREAARIAQSDWNVPIPVLVRLKDYEASGERSRIRGLIQSALESYDPSLDAEAMNQLLQNQKILLLIDGWNEVSDGKAKSKIETFCKPHSVIVTSRNVGDYREIQETFEIQPLSRTAVERFFAQRLPNTQRAKLQELVDRVSDFGQTPLMVWMLFSIFCDDGSIPETRGETYRTFTKAYAKRAKAGIDLDNARKLLGKLAFEMMKSPNPTGSEAFRLKVTEVEAEEIFGSEAELDRMLNHLLKQQGKQGNREISFCHQSLQEYYAAEHLRQEWVQHPEWLQKQTGTQYSWVQHHYLNYTKWTESVAIMLGLPEINQNLAEQVVKSALDVDLMLGARLAGEVQSTFQSQTVKLVEDLEVPDWLKAQFLGTTKSFIAVPFLSPLLNSNEVFTRSETVRALGRINSSGSISTLKKALGDLDGEIRCMAACELASFGDKTVIPVLQEALCLEKHLFRAILAIENIDKGKVIPLLGETLAHENPEVRREVVTSLHLLLHKEYAGIMPFLEIALRDADAQVRRLAAHALKVAGSEEALSILAKAWADEDMQVRNFVYASLGKRVVEFLENDLKEALSSNSSTFKKRATEILLRTKSISEPIIEALLNVAFFDSDFLVRNNASTVLMAVKDSKVIHALGKVLDGDDLQTSQYSSKYSDAIIWLSLICDPESIPILIRVLSSKNKNLSVQTFAIKALGDIGNPIAVSALKENFQRAKEGFEASNNSFEFNSIYRATLLALGKLGVENLEDSIITILKDCSSSVDDRKGCVTTLGKIPTEKARTALVHSLIDENFSVRLSSALILAKQRITDGISVLIEGLGCRNSIDCEDSTVSNDVINALCELGEESLPSLELKLDSQDFQVRKNAKSAIERINRNSNEVSYDHTLTEQSANDYVSNLIDSLTQEHSFFELIEILKTTDSDEAWKFFLALVKISVPEQMSDLNNLLLESESDNISTHIPSLISSIQNHCRFYNYRIWHEAEAMQNEGQGSVAHSLTNVFIETLNAAGAAINLGGAIQGNQIGSQPHPPEP